MESLLHHADEFARREPAKAVVSAFALGILLLPLGAIAFSLVRPALLFFGLRKAREC